ncbi:hypothetical protein DL89DRAFT_262100 [Linderina pennispora]|uniref:F-box domain-containing protein n=1 Tax=Linderina pennispora TaxID=61395 RepID=A0A1Y1VTL9_9FUNG|nr:uncharacterized protein DL89DRAFT_262100 [Linderina pennispora]ORX64639.1 hypothetical protein DL89DRAFT_262100 [Linderina pennispora]
MANFGNLNKGILVIIFDIASKHSPPETYAVDSHVCLLQFSQVCRSWRTTVAPYCYCTAVMAYSDHHFAHGGQLGYPSQGSNIIIETSGGSTSHNAKIWRSNIPHIIQSGNNTKVRRLVVSSQVCRIDYETLGVALSSFGFGTVNWSSLQVLIFTDAANLILVADDRHTSLDDPCASPINTSDFLLAYAPNVNRLIYIPPRFKYGNQVVFPIGRILNSYMPQLERALLMSWEPVNFDYYYFPQHLTILKLQLNSEAVECLPKIFASSLTSLYLFYTDTYHSWHIFYDTLPGPIIFKSS